MRRLVVFNQVSVDGYFVDAGGDMSWAKEGNDEEFNAFVEGNASGKGVLLFGRVTYQMMASFWPTAQARQLMPVVAEGMNASQKVVFSRTLREVTWANTRLVRGDAVAEIRRMKAEPGADLVILGSGTLVSQLAPTGLIDEVQLVVSPLVLGGGRTLFQGVKEPLRLKLARSRVFRNGKVFLVYAPA